MNWINVETVSVKFTFVASLIVPSHETSFPIIDVSHPQLVLERSETKKRLSSICHVGSPLTLFLAQHRLPAPCLPPDDDPRWHALCALAGLGGLGDPDGLGDGRDGGLGQHDGHQVGLAVAAVGQLGLPVGSLRQCCLDVSLQTNEK